MPVHPGLTQRAEQAVLGAALAGGYPATGSLTAGDFASPLHQAIYAALITEPASRGPFTRLRDWLASLFSRQARDARSYLEELPGLCPDFRHGDSYAAMVAEAAAERMAALQARQAAQQERQAALQAQRPRPQALPGRIAPTTPRNSQDGQPVSQRHGPARTIPRQDGGPRDKLAAAGDYLAIPDAGQRRKIAQAASKEASAALSALDPQVARLARALRPAVRSIARQATAAAGPAVASPAPASGATTGRDAERTWLQEQLLTAILRHPGEATPIAGKLPAAAFTAGPHRQVWQMISQHVADGTPFDPLILAWAASQRDDHQASTGEPAAAMTLRLATRDAAPGTASTLARAVHADHLCTTMLGTEWTEWTEMPQKEGHTTRQGGTAPGQQPEQAPAPATTPAAQPAPPSPATAAAPQRPRRQQPAPPAATQAPLLRPPEPSPAGPAPVQ